MKKIFLLYVCFLLAATSVLSQRTDSLLRIYNNQTLYRVGRFFMKGTERLRFQDLKHEFEFSAIAEGIYIRSKRNLTISRLLSLASIGSIIVSGTAINRNLRLSFGLLTGSLVLNLGSYYYRNQSAQFLDRAIWQRNKDLLFKRE